MVNIRQRLNSIRDSSKAMLESAIDGLGATGWRKGVYKLTNANGSEIIFRGLHGATVDSIRSLEGFDVFWCEEAHALETRALSTLLPTVRKEGAIVVFSLNPLDPQQAVYADFVNPETRDDYDGDLLVVEANWDSNPWLDKNVLRDKDRAYARDHEMAEHVWGGKPLLLSAAQVFRLNKHWRIVKAADVEIPSNAIPLYGMDFGLGVHPLDHPASVALGRRGLRLAGGSGHGLDARQAGGVRGPASACPKATWYTPIINPFRGTGRPMAGR